jgi:hypothetical protein
MRNQCVLRNGDNLLRRNHYILDCTNVNANINNYYNQPIICKTNQYSLHTSFSSEVLILPLCFMYSYIFYDTYDRCSEVTQGQFKESFAEGIHRVPHRSWKLHLIACTPSPRTVLRQVSFEQAPYNIFMR